MLSIATNVSAMRAANAMRVAGAAVQRSMERISTGKRINSPADDPANFFIADRMASDIAGLQQSSRNVQDGISFAQTADGALSEATDMMQRIRELAVEAASGTYTDDDRANMQAEVTSLVAQIKAALTSSQFNGRDLFQPSGGADTGVVVQSGSHAGDTRVIGVEEYDLGTLSQLSVATMSDASSSIGISDGVMKSINASRARLGATMNALSSASNNLDNQIMTESDAYHRLVDVDYGYEATQLAKNQLLMNAATAMLAQANQMPRAMIRVLLDG